jgi:hypothetical protein
VSLLVLPGVSVPDPAFSGELRGVRGSAGRVRRSSVRIVDRLKAAPWSTLRRCRWRRGWRETGPVERGSSSIGFGRDAFPALDPRLAATPGLAHEVGDLELAHLRPGSPIVADPCRGGPGGLVRLSQIPVAVDRDGRPGVAVVQDSRST